jgi:hypothetical protein
MGVAAENVIFPLFFPGRWGIIRPMIGLGAETQPNPREHDLGIL